VQRGCELGVEIFFVAAPCQVRVGKVSPMAGVLASLAELELELGRERRAAAREARRARGQHIGQPKSLDESKAALARRMHASGEPVTTIAATLGVSRATVYRTLAEQADGGESPSSNSPI
jgi:DNA invertase Pin-like site-specific DNA recombinase